MEYIPIEISVVGGTNRSEKEKIKMCHPVKQTQETIKVIFNIKHKPEVCPDGSTFHINREVKSMSPRWAMTL